MTGSARGASADGATAERGAAGDRGSRRQYWLARLASGPIDRQPRSFALLTAYGIDAVPAIAVADRAAAAVRPPDALGYPGGAQDRRARRSPTSPTSGGVVLGSRVPGAVGGAFDDLADRLGKRVLVAATAPAGSSSRSGSFAIRQLGPLVVVAAGGVLVELLSDRVVGLPPLDRVRARRLLDRLGVRRLLDGVRGQACRPTSRPSLDAVVAVSILAEELGDGLDALDVNPLRCGPSGVVALDALVVPQARCRALA